MMMKQAFAIFTIRWSSATLFGQTMNTLSAQDSGQGWQLLFDGGDAASCWYAGDVSRDGESVQAELDLEQATASQ
jgi:hypothetical protein